MGRRGTDRDSIRERRRGLKKAYADLVAMVSAILASHDPAGIAGPSNPREYDPEAGSIVPRLRAARSAEDVHAIVIEELTFWFGPDTIPDTAAHAAISADIWRAYQALRRP